MEHLICVKHEQKLDNPQMLELTQSQQGLADPSRYGHFQVNILGIQLNVLGKAARRIQLITPDTSKASLPSIALYLPMQTRH